tara:strand:+ start:2514 stop:2687 length:174 start_codon:yes stop_codon:yes gene_type:complete
MARTTRKKSKEQISFDKENQPTRKLNLNNRSKKKTFLRQIDFDQLDDIDEEDLYQYG